MLAHRRGGLSFRLRKAQDFAFVNLSRMNDRATRLYTQIIFLFIANAFFFCKPKLASSGQWWRLGKLKHWTTIFVFWFSALRARIYNI